MIIGLNGPYGAGKNVAGDYLAREYGFRLASFAALLKQSAAAALGCTVEDLEQWKNDPDTQVAVIRARAGWNGYTISSQTVRSFLQRYGTEAHREIFGTDFWVEQVFANLTPGNIAFTDARFDNELRFIRSTGGVVWRIERAEAAVRAASDTHASEALPDPDLIDRTIDNNGTYDELCARLSSAWLKTNTPVSA